MGLSDVYAWVRSRRPGLFGLGLATAFFTSLATAVVPAVAAAEDAHRPYPCNPDTICIVGDTYDTNGSLKTNQVFVLSHGTADEAQNIFFSGLYSVWARPYGGKHVADAEQKYELQPTSLPDVASWTACTPDAQGFCNPTQMFAQHFRVARFGDGTKWVYQQVSDRFSCPAPGSPATSFAGILLNPKNGDSGFQNRAGTRCEYSTENFPVIEGAFWTTCAASSGVFCRFPNPGTYLVRYREGDNSANSKTLVYRTITGKGITCSASALSNLSATSSSSRSCEYLPLPTFLSVRGNWSLVGLCEKCGDLSFEVTSGMEQGRANEEESAFAWQLGASVTAEAGTPFADVSATVSANYAEDRKDVVSDSFTQSVATGLSVECAGALYQWVTGVQERCMPRNPSSCVSVARSNIFQCVASDQSQSPAPGTPTSGGVSTAAAPKSQPSTTTTGGSTSSTSAPTSTGAASPTPAPIVSQEALKLQKCDSIWSTKLSRAESITVNNLRGKVGVDLALAILAYQTNELAIADSSSVRVESFSKYCILGGNLSVIETKTNPLPVLP